jgi:hypothetical protein
MGETAASARQAEEGSEMTAKIRALCAAILLSSVAGAALAAEPACEPIVKASLAGPQQSARHRVTMEGTVIESVMLKDAMFMRESPTSSWRRVPMDGAKRRAMAEQALVMLPFSQCTGPVFETRGGVAMAVYSYKQSNPLTPGKLDSSRIWIGRDDGLPRRLESDGGVVAEIEYGDFKAPQ